MPANGHEVPFTSDQSAEAQRYRMIYAFQQSGHWRDADRISGTLVSDLLMGHVLPQRYLHPTRYRSPYYELAS